MLVLWRGGWGLGPPSGYRLVQAWASQIQYGCIVIKSQKAVDENEILNIT